MNHILLIEDDLRLSALIAEYFIKQGFRVSTESRGDLGLAKILSEPPDIVILDLMLPEMDGLTVCQKARQDFSGPILMLTAREDDFDQVVGLEMGADDYVKKPVEPRVLLARIRALLRRARCVKNEGRYEHNNREELSFGDLSLSKTSQEVSFAGVQVNVTTNEFSLLWALASAAGNILSREDLFQLTRGIPFDGVDRSVDITISRLRKKLGDNADSPWRIKTVWGQGYLFVKEAWRDTALQDVE
ncbi:response regulator [Desulforhopalus sp. 52FAK]